MFDWVAELLYAISKSIFRLIDGLMACANMLCGITPISVGGEETNFINFLLTHDRIQLGFRVAALMGMILVVLFAIFAIVRSVVTEKGNTTPARVAIQSVKTVMIYLFIPVVMILLVHYTNIFVEALYKATLNGSSDGIGRFLCGAFSQDGVKGDPDFYLKPSFDYTDTDAMWNYVDLWDFDFFFSWVAGFCILLALAQTLLMFVDRAISIVLLFIVSPISLSTNALDDGAHFKLWRDQLLVKFLTGYGCILGINIYILVISAISSDSVVFFSNGFLNNLMKIAFFLGGAVSMQRVMALVGNLVSAGAGSNELRDNAIANQSFKSAVGTMGRMASAPIRAGRSAINFAKDAKQYGVGSAIASGLGLRSNRDYGVRSKSAMAQEKELQKNKVGLEGEMHKSTNADLASMIGNRVADAISGKGSGGDDGQKQTGSGGDKKNNMLDNIISNSSPLQNEQEKK